MDTVNKKHKYILLLSILLGQYVLIEVLSAIGVDLDGTIVNIVAVIYFLVPIILLLNTVGKDTQFNPKIRNIAKITVWIVCGCAVGGFLAEYVLQFAN